MQMITDIRSNYRSAVRKKTCNEYYCTQYTDIFHTAIPSL